MTVPKSTSEVPVLREVESTTNDLFTAVPARRRWPIGTDVIAPGQSHVRVWAPRHQKVDLIAERPSARCHQLQSEGNGYFTGIVEIGEDDLYRFRLDDASELVPDPASRYQPRGPFGPSQVIDPSRFVWSDSAWAGIRPAGRVIYELHVGTFTPEGNWVAAAVQLPRLAEIGINVVEVMPIAEFPGRFGWGYDGVNLFAPSHLYGTPDEFRTFVDRAHAVGVGVILDVVYNHVGPDGNYLNVFSPNYFSAQHRTDWGAAINFDGELSGPVREYYLTNAAYWIAEFHLDGLRLDATQNIYDTSPEHIVAAITRVARTTAGKRSILLVGENEPQNSKLIRPQDEAGFGIDMLWNDDFHHSARVALTGRAEAYYSDHRGSPQEFISSVKYGFQFQGQYYSWQKKGRGTPALDLPPWAFITFLENHDQIANSGSGLRCHFLTSPGRFRAITALLILAPQTPMLFQGQEFASSAPFHFFADHKPELARVVRDGRVKFLGQFPSMHEPESRPSMPDPHDHDTFVRCRLDFGELESHDWAVQLHRDLLRLRREDPTFSRQQFRGVDGAVLGPEALVLRFFGTRSIEDRLLLLNLGVDFECGPMPEPLLAPPSSCRWQIAWSSENSRYGGGGIGTLHLEAAWLLPGHAAYVLSPIEVVANPGSASA